MPSTLFPRAVAKWGAFGLTLMVLYLYIQAPGLIQQPNSSKLPEGWSWDTYHKHEDMSHFLTWLNHTFTGVAQVHSIGHSVEGRELLVVKLSGQGKRDKVEVKVVGGIHGNEQACPEVLLRFVHHLASSYGRCRRVTALLDSTDIYVLPVMNPDGREADTRFNAHHMDLNRNFPIDPLPFDPPGPPSPDDSETVKSWRKVGSGPPEPEVAAVMQWSKAHNFRLSASLHQGALVANYPFDSCDTQGLLRNCPTLDDPLPLFLATAYAVNHPAMHLNNNDSFVQGTVQGAQWYTLMGGMQDWVYWDRNSMELTLELNPVMKPPAQEVAGSMWRHNLPALTRLLELAHLGLQARLLDAQTSKPLMGRVEVVAPSKHRPLHITDPSGSFTMMLAPDTIYCLAIHPQHPHNKHQSFQTIRVAVLHLGGGSVMRGKGLKGLTQRADFLAVLKHSTPSVASSVVARQAAGSAASLWGPPHTSSHSAVAARRLLPHRDAGDVVLLGHATPDMCWFD